MLQVRIFGPSFHAVNIVHDLLLCRNFDLLQAWGVDLLGVAFGRQSCYARLF